VRKVSFEGKESTLWDAGRGRNSKKSIDEMCTPDFADFGRSVAGRSEV
jgi:hypothetical protein